MWVQVASGENCIENSSIVWFFVVLMVVVMMVRVDIIEVGSVGSGGGGVGTRTVVKMVVMLWGFSCGDGDDDEGTCNGGSSDGSSGGGVGTRTVVKMVVVVEVLMRATYSCGGSGGSSGDG